MPLANEQHPIRHLFSVQGPENSYLLAGDTTIIHHHDRSAECNDMCASLDDILTEREESRNRVATDRVVHHDLTVGP